MERQEGKKLRACLREPIAEVYDAARLLDAAVVAHDHGKNKLASELFSLADCAKVREWTESLWGKSSPYVKYREVPGAPPSLPKEERIPVRMPNAAEREALHQRDGFHCRFCNIPLIRKEIRVVAAKAYPDAVSWGRTNLSQHAAFQAMWLQYDHVVPHARGGGNELENLVLTCAPCNYAKWHYLCGEIGLRDPREREPQRSWWDGLERFQVQK